MGTEQVSIIMGCAAMRIIQAASKIAEAADDLHGMIREMEESIVDAGGACTPEGQELDALLVTVIRIAFATRNTLSYIPTEVLIGKVPKIGYAAIEEVVETIRAAATPPAHPTQEARLARIESIRRMGAGKAVAA
jgi:hypothetical protein